jgi:hypothetical protein
VGDYRSTILCSIGPEKSSDSLKMFWMESADDLFSVYKSVGLSIFSHLEKKLKRISLRLIALTTTLDSYLHLPMPLSLFLPGACFDQVLSTPCCITHVTWHM